MAQAFSPPRRTHRRATRAGQQRRGYAHCRCRSSGDSTVAAGEPLLVHALLVRMGRPQGQSRGGLIRKILGRPVQNYVMLLDWTGREIRENKCGAIPDNMAPILDRSGLDRSNWVKTVREFGRMFKLAAGRASSLARAAPRCSRRWFQGKAAAQAAFV